MEGHIRLEHGSGGALSRELIEDIIYPRLSGVAYPALSDGTDITCLESMCMTTDTYVVDPPFFPGGDIGKLCIFGTCNDLAVSGAAPQYISLGFVLEEGYPLAELEKVLESIALASDAADVSVVTGDTKVVPAGKGGGIYINSTGIGYKEYTEELGPSCIVAGDTVIVSGPVGAHGIAVLAAREDLPVGKGVVSDCANLYPLCRDLYSLGDGLRFMRDATRGGLAAVLNESVAGLSTGVLIRESDIPVNSDVASAANILGLNPLEIANEGVCVAVVDSGSADEALTMMSGCAAGRNAAAIGSVVREYPGKVYLETTIGGRRMVDLPRGLLLPRIC